MADLTRKDVEDMQNANIEFTLIDVRDDWEHSEFNIGGRNLPLGGIQEWITGLAENKDAKYVMYCRSGARSGMAASFMTAQGFSDTHNLAGGVLAWQAEDQ